MAIIPRLVFGFLALTSVVFLSSSVVSAQATAAPPSIKRDSARPLQSVEGADIYQAYCAVCHGVDLKGQGPAAPAMKMPPTDLTTYAQRHDGKFSEMDMRAIIDGQNELAAHGSRDMPIWGDVFRALTHTREMREMRMKNLIDYLRQMQGK